MIACPSADRRPLFTPIMRGSAGTIDIGIEQTNFTPCPRQRDRIGWEDDG